MSTLHTLPGLIDCHVHFREPGFPEKSTMASEALSARHGGVQCVCEMPNTNPPTTTVEALRDKIQRADAVSNCDIRFYFGSTKHEHIQELVTAWNDPSLRRRLSGVKVYFDHSTGNQCADMDVISALFKAAATHNIPVIGHCEDPEMNNQAAAKCTETDISAHSTMRPAESEVKSIQDAVELSRQTGAQFQVAHLSTAGGLEVIKEAKAEGLPITCEVAPHHLFLTTDDYEHLGTFGKMNPPLRSKDDQQALWEGVVNGDIDCIATDHAPHSLQEKQTEPVLSAPSGIPGVETMLPLLLSVVSGHWPNPNSSFDVSSLGFTLDHIRRCCFENPNRIFSLNVSPEPSITVDLDQTQVIQADALHSQCTWTPFDGWTVQGSIVEGL